MLVEQVHGREFIVAQLQSWIELPEIGDQFFSYIVLLLFFLYYLLHFHGEIVLGFFFFRKCYLEPVVGFLFAF